MAAVAAAILAAFLAGAIALFRERRLEARRLQVAARITQATLMEALNNARNVSMGKVRWSNFVLKPSEQEIVGAWVGHRDILAGHLSRTQWTAVYIGFHSYLMLFHLGAEAGPQNSDWDPMWEEILERLIAASDALEIYCA
jgi:hypothetical protein